MNIQSISIVVPTKGCVNSCKFCVSSMHESPYEDHFDEISYRKRIKYAAMNGVNTLILTGTGEALQNTSFLSKLALVLEKEHHPFPNVELQTSGVMLTNQEESVILENDDGRLAKYYPNISLLKRLGVNTVSLSVSDIFDSDNNWDINGTPEVLRKSLIELTQFIKKQGFNLRLSLNMTNVYNKIKPFQLYKKCYDLGANQITLRKLYYPDEDPRIESPQTKWVKNNSCDEDKFFEIEGYITGNEFLDPDDPIDGTIVNRGGYGKPLYRLPFGAMVYSYEGMSIAIDDNCMSKNNTEDLKYVILRENGKLYCQWDDEGSLIF
ncbi:MAG: radical SAM protein [Candidatus Cloacimonetes bacterium]|nr:radical SAM protein [Candidatus Cloacimonadota bacterium]